MHFLKTVLAFFLTTPLFASGPGTFIFGGETVSPTDPLYAFAPAIVNHGKFRCSCVLIEEDIILTAAHCTPGGPFELYFSGDIDGEGEYRTLIKEETHPQYNQSTLENDLAVARFRRGLPPGYRALSLAGEDVGKIGKLVTLLGFGASVSDESGKGTGILRKAEVVTKAVSSQSPLIYFDQSQKKGACYGDSGGPAVVWENNQFSLLGIASFVDPDCGGESIYTRPFRYAKWIREAIERLRLE